MPSGPTRVLFMGTPAYVIPLLEVLVSTPRIQVVGVYTPPDRPKGRGRAMDMPPVKSFAIQREILVRQPASLRPAGVQQELAELQPDVIVVAAYGKLLPPAVLRIPPHGCLNLHPSLLPSYRGPSPVATAILDGIDATGVTLMLLDEGMDTGPIIAQRELGLTGRETAEPLTSALFQMGAGMLTELLEPWTEGHMVARPQDDALASTTRKLQREDGQADWRLSALSLERRSRAYTPWPGLFTTWDGKVLKLLDVVPLLEPADQRVEPGRVVLLADQKPPLGVGTSEGLLGLRTVQLEGRRAQSARDFMQGYPAFVDARL